MRSNASARAAGAAVNMAIAPPAAFINSNQRLHHQVKARLTKAWRQAALAAARWVPEHQMEHAHVTVWIRFPDNTRRDVGNWYPTAKAILDGIVESRRFLLDDDDLHVLGPDMRREYPNGPARVRVELREVEAE